MNKKCVIVLLIILMLVGASLMNTFTISANIAINTPTLAPTMCPGWYENGMCSPTQPPIVICLPDPCVWFPPVHNIYMPIIRLDRK